jgi:hypothetical protein
MSLHRFLAVGLICAGLFLPAMPPAAAITPPSLVLVAYGPLAMFTTEDAARAHCPSDVVVWLNTKTGIWHEKGMRWYGRTKQGAYVCRKEAAAAGYRDTENGQ